MKAKTREHVEEKEVVSVKLLGELRKMRTGSFSRENESWNPDRREYVGKSEFQCRSRGSRA